MTRILRRLATVETFHPRNILGISGLARLRPQDFFSVHALGAPSSTSPSLLPLHLFHSSTEPIILSSTMAANGTTTSPSPFVTLVSSDGFEFHVRRSAACVSATIRRMLDLQSTLPAREARL